MTSMPADVDWLPLDLAVRLRRALYARLAADLAALKWIDDNESGLWPCCWVEYAHGREGFIHRICGQGDQPCAHWHHRHEIAIAADAPDKAAT